MADRTDRQRSTSPRLQGAVDVAWLERDLLGTWDERRLAARAKAADPRYQRLDDLTMGDHRARVLEQMHALVDDGAGPGSEPACGFACGSGRADSTAPARAGLVTSAGAGAAIGGDAGVGRDAGPADAAADKAEAVNAAGSGVAGT